MSNRITEDAVEQVAIELLVGKPGGPSALRRVSSEEARAPHRSRCD